MMSSGILKQVKDHIRECAHCQSRRGADDGSGPRLFARPGRRRAANNANDEDEEEEEDGADASLLLADSSPQLVSRLAKTTAKHELVFVCPFSFIGAKRCDKDESFVSGLFIGVSPSRWTAKAR